MLLAAYGLGRIGVGLIPAWHRSLSMGMAALLVISQAAGAVWLSVLLFLPIGALAASTDAVLVAQLERLGDAPLRWQVICCDPVPLAGWWEIGLGVICQLLTLGHRLASGGRWISAVGDHAASSARDSVVITVSAGGLAAIDHAGGAVGSPDR